MRQRRVLTFALVGFTGVFLLGAATSLAQREEDLAAVVAGVVARVAFVGALTLGQATLNSLRR